MKKISLVVLLLTVSVMVSTLVFSADINTELMDAIRAKNVQKSKDAISKGANINANINSVNESGITPLMIAATSDVTVEIGKLLIEKGADVNAKDLLGWTPLIYATYSGQTAFVKLLIKKRADVNARSNTGWTPLMYAAYSGRVEIGKLLIEKGADVNAISRAGETALSIAQSRSDSDFADLLRNKNAK